MLKGKALKYGSNIDTDAIIPARYLNVSDPSELAHHCMEDIDNTFQQKAEPGDILVALSNFGCGSSREHAPVAIKEAGISCIIAESFARIFFRNAINIGLPLLESKEAAQGTDDGDEIEVDLSGGKIYNLTKNEHFSAKPYPLFMTEIISSGGLIEFTKKRIVEEELS
jgi:3-isopropylmalate/(R)-2-methylmalate dehydratase small subunit